MIRSDLENIPEFVLPPGYGFRLYKPGDETLWTRIHLAADRYNRITPELFAEQFGQNSAALAERQFYLINPTGDAIGTGTAWFVQVDNDPIGRVHWVAILPQYQGRGLSKPLMTTICSRLRELGHQRAYLTTSPARSAAIGLYLRFGFVPWPVDAVEEEVWRKVLLARSQGTAGL
jgi:GNAT superfamily N-acetyltransferase